MNENRTLPSEDLDLILYRIFLENLKGRIVQLPFTPRRSALVDAVQFLLEALQDANIR